MKNTCIVLLSLLVLGLLTGCEKDAVGVKLPKQGPKLVITSYISPQDTLIWVTVSNTQPVFGIIEAGSDQRIEDAHVTLSDGNQQIKLLFQTKQRAYAVDPALFPIKPGTTYYLEVQVPDGRQVKASCTVPKDTVTISQVRLDSAISDNRNLGPMRYDLTFQWTDISGVPNYYRTGAEATNYSENYWDYWAHKGKAGQIINPIYAIEEFQTDKDADGVSLNTRKTKFYGWKIPRPFKVFVYVMNADVHYYKYHYDLYNYQEDNPFAEPALFYTNIEGGIGIFGAYTRSEAVLEVE